MSDDLLNLFEQMNHGFDPDEKRRQYKKSPLNLTGSKRETLYKILDLLPYQNTFVDVFGGSGAVILERKPSRLDVFNDRHSGVCDFFRAARDEPDRLIEQIELMPHSREQFQRFLLHSQDDYVVRAAIFYYLVQCSFGGRGEAFGRVVKDKNTILQKLYKNLELFSMVHARFKQITIENLDWSQIFSDYDGYDVVFYCDPPYFESDIYKHGIDHKAFCDRIFELKGFVAVSGYDSSLYDKYPWDGTHVFELQNRITCDFGSRSDYRFEFLWIKEGK